MTKAILVIEPDLSIQPFVRMVLEEEGYNVNLAQSMEQAAVLLSNSRFDLVITEAFGQSRRLDFDPTFLGTLRGLTGDKPIILASTFTPSGGARSLGLAEVLQKPFDLHELTDKVNKVLGKTKLNRTE